MNIFIFKKIINAAFDNNIGFGFDSCGCNKFLKAVEKHKDYEQLKTLAEPCESSCFSMYSDVNGYFYPCSFCEGVDKWKEGLSIIDCDSFITDIWYHEKTIKFRNNLIAKKRKCPIYTI